MSYAEALEKHLDRLRDEGRYRTFADVKRRRGRSRKPTF
jgi:hypothetical protein